jgi:hypothetical protein
LAFVPAPPAGAVVWTFGWGCINKGGPLLRSAVVAGTDSGHLQLLQAPGPGCRGDSGGAVLDAAGDLVGVLSRFVELPEYGRYGVEAVVP